MHIREKALYNLLRFNWLNDPSLEVQSWQVDNYRSLDQKKLFDRLDQLGIVLDEAQFRLYAEESDTPEELLSQLWAGKEENGEAQDQAYLILFELWRRLLPERETLTIFCDALDNRIFNYAKEGTVEGIDELLVRLEDILDSYVDSGENPKKVFQAISSSCACDIERFLFEYIMDLIDSSEGMLASEIIDGFYEYVADPKRFEFLRIHLFADVDPQETALLLGQLVESLDKAGHFDLLLEIARFLVSFGQDPLYRQIIIKALSWMETEEEFIEILNNLQDYFCCLDQDDKRDLVEEILKKRAHHNPESKIHLEDQDIEKVKRTVLSEK